MLYCCGHGISSLPCISILAFVPSFSSIYIYKQIYIEIQGKSTIFFGVKHFLDSNTEKVDRKTPTGDMAGDFAGEKGRQSIGEGF